MSEPLRFAPQVFELIEKPFADMQIGSSRYALLAEWSVRVRKGYVPRWVLPLPGIEIDLNGRRGVCALVSEHEGWIIFQGIGELSDPA